jgi:hypothetical protein
MVLDELDFILEHRPGYSYKDIQNMPIFKRRLIINKIIQKADEKNNRDKPNADQQKEGQKKFKERINNLNKPKSD